MDVKYQQGPSFGWFIGTHKRLTRLAVKECPNLFVHRRMLEEYAQKPDFDELGVLGNWHFYSPENKKSFLDFNSRNNAHSLYKEHVAKMALAIKENSISDAVKHAGRALHFLQDMTQPLHTQKGFLFNKILHLRSHLKFEKFIKHRQVEYFSEYENKMSKEEMLAKSFDQIFWDTVHSSRENELPVNKNRYAWERIGEVGIHQAITSTRAFVYKFSDLINPINKTK